MEEVSDAGNPPEWEVQAVLHRASEIVWDDGVADLSGAPDGKEDWEPFSVTEDNDENVTVFWRRRIAGRTLYRCGHGYEGFCLHCLVSALQGQVI